MKKDLENHEDKAAEQTLPPRTALSAHTPGPWHVGGLDRNDQPQVLGQAGDLVAVITHECVKRPPVLEANARLIAAAPDLLAALQGISRNAALDDAWLAPVRAAITKATGAA